MIYKSIYTDEELAAAINHLFPIDRGEFFVCLNTGKYIQYCYVNEVFKCKYDECYG